MNEYRILVPIGGQLPQAGAVIQSQDADFKGEKAYIQVATINGITWGTRKIDGKEVVAGIFVELLGMPYPQIKLTPDAEKARARMKHFIVYDAVTAEAKACFNGDDKTQEVHPGKCPVCKKQKKEQTTKEEAKGNLEGMAEMLEEYGINIEGCTSYEEVLKLVLKTAKKKTGRKRKKWSLCHSCVVATNCDDQDKATTQETGTCEGYGRKELPRKDYGTNKAPKERHG